MFDELQIGVARQTCACVFDQVTAQNVEAFPNHIRYGDDAQANGGQTIQVGRGGFVGATGGDAVGGSISGYAVETSWPPKFQLILTVKE
jgi:hypothetical protein